MHLFIENVLDGLNSADKQFLIIIIMNLYVTEDTTKKSYIDLKSSTNNSFTSLADELIFQLSESKRDLISVNTSK